MRRNAERRTALTDAAITVLARDGARGLTYRSIDSEAGVPPGTTSNYFSSRDQLLGEAGLRVHERLSPGEEVMENPRSEPPSRARLTELLTDIMRRLTTRDDLYLALLELRLEATRRPDLAASLTRTINDSFSRDVRFHEDAGLPGGVAEVAMMHLTLTGLALERLTLPGALTEIADAEVIARLVDRLVGVAAD